MHPLSDRRGQILHNVRQIALQHLHGLEVSLYLFGSWARKEEQQSSDIDLGVYYKKPLPRGTLAKLRIIMEESNIPYKVDIVDLTETNSGFREKVMGEGIEWSVYRNE